MNPSYPYSTIERLVFVLVPLVLLSIVSVQMVRRQRTDTDKPSAPPAITLSGDVSHPMYVRVNDLPPVEVSKSYSIIWANTKGSGHVMRVRGIPTLIPIPAEGLSVFRTQEQQRPETPEDVQVELWTKDGRHWKAKWEETP